MEDLFQTPTTLEFDPNSNYVEQLVGEGKKFTDPNKLAFGKLQADQHIERIQRENEAMRKELLTRQRLEELVTKLSTTADTTQSTSNNNNQDSERHDGESKTMTGLTPEQAEQMITTKMREKENFDRALNGIKAAFGDDYQTKLDTEAKRLGLSTEDVNKLAKTNVDLFLRIFQEGSNKPPTDNMYTPSSSINTSSLSSQKAQLIVNGVRTEQYYKDLKAKDAKTYWSPKVQLQEHNDALKLGPAFFNA